MLTLIPQCIQHPFRHLILNNFRHLLTLMLACTVTAQSGQVIPTLEPGKPVERELAGGQSHSYPIVLKGGQFVQIVVDQRGIDVLVALVGADGKTIVERDRPNGKHGQESLAFIAMKAGDYQLDVRALDQAAETGRYEIRTDAPRTPDDRDRKRVAAETAFQEGAELSKTGSVEPLKEVCRAYETSAELSHEINDKYAEAVALESLGYARQNLGESEAAVIAQERALSLYRELKDKRGEASSLAGLGMSAASLQKRDKAIESYRQAKAIYGELKDADGEQRLRENFRQEANGLQGFVAKLLLKEERESFKQALTIAAIAQAIYVELRHKPGEAEALALLGYISDTIGENRQALNYYTQSLSLMRELRNKAGEARALNNIGSLYDSWGRNREALAYLIQALPLYSQTKDQSGKALNLSNIAQEYGVLNQKRRALYYFGQALRESRVAKDKSAEATTLANIGLLYSSLEEKTKAISYFKQALLLWPDKRGRARTLTAMGGVYDDLGDQQKALACYNEALPLTQAIADRAGEAAVLHNIGNSYSSRGDNRKALDYFNQSAALFKAVENAKGELTSLAEVIFISSILGDKQKALADFNQLLPRWRALEDKRGEATTLNYLGNIYDDLGEEQQAVNYYRQALRLFRVEARKQDEAKVLNNLGGAYDDLGDKQKALKYFNQALHLWQVIGDKSGKGTTLNNIGRVYEDLKENQNARNYLDRSLALAQTVGNRRGEGRTLAGLGRVCNRLGERQKALQYLNQAVLLLNAIGDKPGEAAGLSNLTIVWHDLKNPRLAALYGKQSVNILQQQRSAIEGLDKEIQKTFLRSVETPYRDLVDVLVEQGRSAEAQQVLNAFKDQQYFDFSPEALKTPVPLAMTPREAEAASRYDVLGEAVGKIQTQIEEFKRPADNQIPSPAKLQQLENDLKTATNQFLSFIKEAETQFTGPPDAVKDKSPDIADTLEMQGTLRQITEETNQAAVAIYTAVGETKIDVVVVSTDNIFSLSMPIKGAELNRKARELWALSKSPDYNPTSLSNELYKVIFEPIEDKLPKGTKTIIWSLDGNLRYLPMASLYDGQQYLVEKYNHVVFTRADKERLSRSVAATWTGYGFGTAAPHNVELSGESIPFDAIDFVEDELTVFRTKTNPDGIIDGDVLLEGQFTKASLIKTLKQTRPLVHMSSHFRFLPGDASNSFLVLGDGRPMTLAEMKAELNLFQGVELLTLSACDSGAQRPDATGKEVDAFAELAQRLGTGAVMASLWSVRDRSTAELMKAFYGNRQGGKYTKAEALRQAQLDLLYGRNSTAPVASVATRSAPAATKGKRNSDEDIVLNKRYLIPFKPDPKRPFAHPYYWSPFVLFGNWK